MYIVAIFQFILPYHTYHINQQSNPNPDSRFKLHTLASINDTHPQTLNTTSYTPRVIKHTGIISVLSKSHTPFLEYTSFSNNLCTSASSSATTINALPLNEGRSVGLVGCAFSIAPFVVSFTPGVDGFVLGRGG